MENTTRKEGVLSKVARQVEDNFFDFSSVIGPISIPIIFGFKNEILSYVLPWVFYLIIFAIIMLILYAYHKNKKKRNEYINENEDLKKSLSEIQNNLKNQKTLLNKATEETEKQKSHIRKLHRELANVTLRNMDRNLKLTSESRVSIYFEKGGVFHILGRYSMNPEYNKISTLKFPIDGGALSKAWQLQKYENLNCPVFKETKSGISKKYIQYQNKNFGYSEETVKKWKMKSCCYIGVGILKNKTTIGVVLYESIDKKLENETIRKQISDNINELNDELVSLLEEGMKIDGFISNNLEYKPEAEVLSEIGVKS